VLVLAVVCLLSGCTARAHNAPRLRAVVVTARPHDRAAFTEGLEIDGGVLYESTGIVGASGVRALDLATGNVLASSILPPPDFGEGVTLAGGTLWELTWRDHDAIDRDPRTLVERRRVNFDGEGWGLCHRRGLLVMSNGTNALTFRNPVSFAKVGVVGLQGWDDAQLNSLNCATDGTIYANVWPTDHILHINPDTGTVLAQIDASGLRRLPDGPGPLNTTTGNVLNGIAQVPGTDHFLLSGKYWPTTYEVRFER